MQRLDFQRNASVVKSRGRVPGRDLLIPLPGKTIQSAKCKKWRLSTVQSARRRASERAKPSRIPIWPNRTASRSLAIMPLGCSMHADRVDTRVDDAGNEDGSTRWRPLDRAILE